MMPRKIKDLIQDLKNAGFSELSGGGKGSHRKFIHPKYAGAVTVSGQSEDDAKHYQEKHISQVIESIKK